MANKRTKNYYKGENRDYEFSLIIHQKLSVDEVNRKLEEIAEIAKSYGAEVRQIAKTAIKSYAYAIDDKKNKKGYYGCIYLSTKPENIAEIRRKALLRDNVIRVLVVLVNPKKFSLGIFSPSYEDESSRAKKKFFVYNDPNALLKFTGERGKIEPRKQPLSRRVTKGVAKRQRTISRAIKQSRYMSLLPFVED